MRLLYDMETDSLYIEFNTRGCSSSREIAKDIVLDFDENGDVVGIDIQHASRKMDLKTVEVESLPIPGLKR